MKKYLIPFLFLLNSCTPVDTVDDYLLGKDNAPTPKPLAPIKTDVPLKTKWIAPTSTQGKDNAWLKLQPAVSSHFIYTADAQGHVSAVERATGKIRWQKNLPMPLVSGPVIHDNRLILGTAHAALLALNADTGQEIWQTKVSGNIYATPAVHQNKVFAKTMDGNLYAIDLKTGHRIWLSKHGAPQLVLKAASSPVVAGNKVLVGYADGKIDALDIHTGRTLWQRQIAYAGGVSDVERLVDIDTDPIIHDQVAYLGSYQSYVGAISLNDGQTLWQKPVSVYKNMALEAGVLYVVDIHDVVWAIQSRNGQVLWKQTALKHRNLSSPAIKGQFVLLGDSSGLLHLLSSANGQLAGRMPVSGAVKTSPLVVGKNIYVSSSAGKLACYAIG